MLKYFQKRQSPQKRHVMQHSKPKKKQHHGSSSSSSRKRRRIICFGILIRRYYGLSSSIILLTFSLWRIWYFVYKYPFMMTDCDEDCLPAAAQRGSFPLFRDLSYESMSFNTTTTVTPTTSISRVVETNRQPPQRLQLRYNWTDLHPTLELTKLYKQHQSNCSLPMGDFKFRSNYGLGSDLHIWGWGLCNSLASGIRIRTIKDWSWLDQTQCSDFESPINCYFSTAELQCPNDIEFASTNRNYTKNQYSISKHNGRITEKCHQQSSSSLKLLLNGSTVSYRRMAALEYLFTNVSPRVVQEAEMQLNYVFGNPEASLTSWAMVYYHDATTNTKSSVGNSSQKFDLYHNRSTYYHEVPKSLITVHIRWGDKKREMKLVSIEEYINAVKRIIERRHNNYNDGISTTKNIDTNSYPAHIYLATEDPRAVIEFQKSMPKSWHVYVDYTFHKTLPYRSTTRDNELLNGASKISRQLNGQAGLWTLASLLVAMESNDFVLTTASNWSRLMNELRLTIVNPRCGNCTTMIDLRPSKRNDD